MTIRVYSGEGSSPQGSPILIDMFQKHLPDITTAPIDDHEMRTSEAWKRDTSLLVFSAATVGLFKKALGEDVLNDIKNGVHEGAFNYAGICAGACLASHSIKYRLRPVQSPKDILVETNGLSMLYAHASGPCRLITQAPYSGEVTDLHLITVRDAANLETTYNVFYWGGPTIKPLERIPLAKGGATSFLNGTGQPMSYKVKYGQGTVTACSYHPEITAENLLGWASASWSKWRSSENTQTKFERLTSMAKGLDGKAFERFLRHLDLIPA